MDIPKSWKWDADPSSVFNSLVTQFLWTANSDNKTMPSSSTCEYIQLIDANQDNYWRCLRFEVFLPNSRRWLPITSLHTHLALKRKDQPGAILGAVNTFFSEYIGILGDVAAERNKPLVPLSPVLWLLIGGKLHYGQPDFLNGIFMTPEAVFSKLRRGSI